MAAPTGTITFLFSDIEGSTRLWERHPEGMRVALRRHDEIVRSAAETHAGYVFKTIGDAFCVAFDRAGDAVAAVADIQQALHAGEWEETGPLMVRMALHVGAAEFRDNDYFGNSLNRVARILAAAHGGQVLLSLPVEELVRDHLAPGVLLRDLGERRLRDLVRPEHLFQLVLAGLPSEFPPLRSLEVTPNNLPTLLNTFIGRERERDEVKRLLGATRLLTLTGTGGTGKTRLALQVAEEMLGDYPDGVWLVELATISDPHRIVEVAAGAVGLREEPDEPMRATLIRFLCGRRVLLILDNCEHVLDECAALVAEILRGCSTIKILATSRHSLGIAGEHTWAVPPLSVLNPANDLFQVSDIVSTVSQYEAVRLFIDRAAAVKPGFEVTRQNAAAIAQICWRLDGIPLAIELAAARARVLTPEQISQRLDDRFRLLTGGGRSVLPHQQTLRTLIDWSYDLLSESERVLFRRLGVFGGGRTIEAIEAICTGDGVDAYDALDLLQLLVDKSLLSVETDAADATRYTMIESVWHYARERLEASGEFPALRDRHLDYFLALAEEARPQLEGRDTARWLDLVTADQFNFRLAFEWASRSEANVQKGLRIAGALTRHVEIRGNLEEARAILDLLLNAPGAGEPTLARAYALLGAGRIAWCRDSSEEALGYYREGVALLERFGRRRDAILQSAFMGFLERNLGLRDGVEARFQRAIDAGREFNDVALTAVGLNGLGSCAADRGDFARSRRLREESLAIYRVTGDQWVCGYMLWGLARDCVAAGDAVRARDALEEWTAIARSLGNRWITPYLLQLFGGVLLIEGDIAAAARTLGAAEAGREALGIAMDATDLAEWEATVAQLDEKLDPTARLREWNAGRSLGVWEAIDFATRARPRAAAA
ncbi:MAG: adenylate/guanylate cyclase domain-containing protein [Terrimicrobiaceae bacterium]|nr:adenylate/guanylate cyclase domain-containing protein [Terrimicrobiaceae bacterium]